MTHRPAFPLPFRPGLALLAGLLLVAFAAPPAPAGLGGLKKGVTSRLGKAVGDKAEEKVAPPDAGPASAPAFDEVMLELTAARLDQFLKGAAAARRASAGRADLVAGQLKIQREAADLRNRDGDAIDAAQQKRAAAQRARESALEGIQRQKQEDLRRRGESDPAFRAQLMAMTVKLGQAQARGDTAAMAATQREMEAMASPSHDDTLAVDARLGPIPPEHPSAVRLAALDARSKAMDDRIRDLDAAAAQAAAEGSGLTPVQYAMAQERITMYLAALAAKQPARGFSQAELSALAARKDALQAAV